MSAFDDQLQDLQRRAKALEDDTLNMLTPTQPDADLMARAHFRFSEGRALLDDLIARRAKPC